MLASSSTLAGRPARLGRPGARAGKQGVKIGSRSTLSRLQSPDSDQLWLPPSAARDVRPRAVPGFNQATIKARGGAGRAA
jgi:hypothetical protein